MVAIHWVFSKALMAWCEGAVAIVTTFNPLALEMDI